MEARAVRIFIAPVGNADREREGEAARRRSPMRFGSVRPACGASAWQRHRAIGDRLCHVAGISDRVPLMRRAEVWQEKCPSAQSFRKRWRPVLSISNNSLVCSREIFCPIDWWGINGMNSGLIW
jgi:hypothetical protein